MSPKGRLLLLSSLFLVLALGCRDRNPNAPASVSGTVTYKGSALTAGTLTFHSSTSGAATTPIAPDGSYSLVDLPVGEMTVTVETESANPKVKTETYGSGQGKGKSMVAPAPDGAGAPPPKAAGQYVKIPDKYSNAKQSDLKVTLVRGKQKKNFELTD